MQKNEIKMIDVPKYQELAVKNLINDMMEDPMINQYLPDISHKGRPIDRKFFFNILNTL